MLWRGRLNPWKGNNRLAEIVSQKSVYKRQNRIGLFLPLAEDIIVRPLLCDALEFQAMWNPVEVFVKIQRLWLIP
jgi:hypothetical protein